MSNGLKKADVMIPNDMNLVKEATEETLTVQEATDAVDLQADHHAEGGVQAEAEVGVEAHHQEEEVTEIHTILAAIEAEALVVAEPPAPLVALAIEALAQPPKIERVHQADHPHLNQEKKGIPKMAITALKTKDPHLPPIIPLSPLLLSLSKALTDLNFP
jgi:hypothetical protein